MLDDSPFTEYDLNKTNNISLLAIPERFDQFPFPHLTNTSHIPRQHSDPHLST